MAGRGGGGGGGGGLAPARPDLAPHLALRSGEDGELRLATQFVPWAPAYPTDERAARTLALPAALRPYQREAAVLALTHSALVALPTGLGKTAVAAAVASNVARWHPGCIVLFIVPTRPLVAQQAAALAAALGLSRGPGGGVAEHSGGAPPAARHAAWARPGGGVIVSTAETAANDLAPGGAGAPGRVALLVLDEAHRATGAHAYAKVARALDAAGVGARVLALSATPGADVPAVARLLRRLHLSAVYVRSLADADVAPYAHDVFVDLVTVPPRATRDARLRAVLLALLAVYARGLRAAGLLASDDPEKARVKALLAAREELEARAAGGGGGGGWGAGGGGRPAWATAPGGAATMRERLATALELAVAVTELDSAGSGALAVAAARVAARAAAGDATRARLVASAEWTRVARELDSRTAAAAAAAAAGGGGGGGGGGAPAWFVGRCEHLDLRYAVLRAAPSSAAAGAAGGAPAGAAAAGARLFVPNAAFLSREFVVYDRAVAAGRRGGRGGALPPAPPAPAATVE